MQIPYMFPLFLGMTFDARSLRPGVDLFEAKYVDDPVVNELGQFISVYKVVTSQSEVQEALDIDGDLSLKIKSGLVNVEGKGAYIKNEETDENKISILISSHYTSVVKAFKPGAKLRTGWEDLADLSHSTHYVKEVHYGAEFITDAKFIVLNSNDTNAVKAEIKASLNTEGNSTDLFVNGTLDLLKKKLSGRVNLEISYYATVPLSSVPTTLKGLEELIESFQVQYGKTENGVGAPIAVALEPVSYLFQDEKMKDHFRFLKNEELQTALLEFGEKFQELRQVRLDLQAWSKALPYDISPSLKSEIGKLYMQILKALDAFFETLWRLDVTQGPEQLNEANAKYDPDDTYRYRRYINKLNDLKAQYDSSNLLKEVSGATYIRWGNDKCPEDDSDTVGQGFVYSSPENGIGGTSKYDCADNSVKLAEDLVQIEQFAEHFITSEIAVIHYPEINSKHTPFVGHEAKKVSGKGIPCSRCHNPYLATVTMFPGTTQCPITWKLVYKGFLASSRADFGQTTEYICLDEEPSTPKHVDVEPFPRYDSVAFTTVNSQGSLPSENYKKGPLRCVVCSINRNLKLFFKEK